MPTVPLFKVGADPEFSFLRGRSFVHADHVISRVRSNFGLDGCSSIAELRPNPSTSPTQVVRNIYNDLLQGYFANPETRRLYWKAGSYNRGDGGYSTGGHIHFGLNAVYNRRLFGSRNECYLSLIRYLDCYLGQLGRLLDRPADLRSRLNSDYGFLGDYRTNPHGVEYRVLGSWLTSPHVAEGVLCLAQTIAYQHLWLTAHKKPLNIDDITPYSESDEYGEPTDGPSNLAAQLKVYRQRSDRLMKDIRKFKLYKKHQAQIEFIFSLIDKKKCWYPGRDVDMKKAWGIHNKAKKTSRKKKKLPSVKFNDIWGND